MTHTPKAENSAIQATLPEQECAIDGYTTVYQLIEELWERASKNLTPKELEWFADATDRAEYELFNLKNTIEHTSCNVLSSNDMQSPDAVSQLLFTLSNHLDAIHGLVNVGMDASFLLPVARGQK